MPDTIVAEPDATEVRASIRTIARTAGLAAEWADSQIDAGADVVAARSAAFEAMTARGTPLIRTQVGPSNDDPAVILERAAEALACQLTGATPSDAARPLMGMRFSDHARAALVRAGVSGAVSMSGETLIRTAMHTVSDFPGLLTSTGNRILMPAYQAAASPLKMLARQTTALDFRPMSRIKLGDFNRLKPVTESGEIKALTTGEADEGYKLGTFGGLFNLSRQAMINDELGALAQFMANMGKASAETEAAELVALLTLSNGAGPVMNEDGKRVFATEHGNIEANAGYRSAPNTQNLGSARLALRTMRAPGGSSPISAVPKYLLVGADLETAGEQALAELNPTNAGEVNPFAGKLTLLVEPRLPPMAWYLFADPATVPVLEFAYLASAPGPQLASRDGWDVLGREFRVTLDFGCGAVDYRGAFRNAGQ